jgi:hypothetical protein
MLETYNRRNLIKTGFWLGIGFIGPAVALYLVASILLSVVAWLSQTAAPETIEMDTDVLEKVMAPPDETSKVRIVDFREVRNGNRLLILGSVRNTGAAPVGSIQIEAELLDAAKKLVLECAADIARRLKPRESENFQVICDYGQQPVPKYQSVELRVINASGY